MRVRVLGPLEVGHDGQWQRLSAAKQRSLLSALVIDFGRPVSVDRLTEELWPDGPPRTADNQIHVYVVRLRRALGDPAGTLLTTRSPGYELTAEPDDIDALVFERQAGEGIQALRDGDTERAETVLTQALDLWRGPAFTDVPETPGVRAEADRLSERRLAALESRIDAGLRLGRHSALVTELQALVDAHPFRERFWGQLMLALYRSGRQADALQAYRRAFRLLADELGLEPGPELARLEQAILTGDSSLDLAGEAGPAGAGVAGGAGTGGAGTRGAGTGGAGAGLERLLPAQLPPDIASFSGRTEELRRLDALLPAGDEAPETVVITTIEGTAGVGKSALAVHWAHRVAHRFPDGQLYANLRGFDPVGVATHPAEAIRGFLDVLEVPPDRIPAGLDAQAGLYRSLLASRRVLVVLDNARDADHVRPLLPGSPGCLAVVTSRNQLSGLVASEGAHPLMLDVLPDDEARMLLVGRLGRKRVADEPAAVEAIIERCARLPLALAIVAARAATNPGFELAALADELRDAGEAGAGDVITTGESATDLRTVFSWSYDTLKPETARLFRLLSVHPGPDIAAPAAAALAGLAVGAVRRRLAELTRAHLVDEHVPGRFRFHDLLRAYATELAAAQDGEPERTAALSRVLDFYVHTAQAAALVLDPARKPPTLAPAQPGVVAEKPVAYDEAVSWFAAEHLGLLAAMKRVAEVGLEEPIWQLAWSFWDFLDKQGHWNDWLFTQHAALDAATRASDRNWQARAHGGLGTVYARLGDYDSARTHMEQAAEVFVALGETTKQAGVLLSLAHLAGLRDDYAGALRYAATAQALFHKAGDRAGRADALNAVGWCHAQLGDHEEALACCREAIALQVELGDREGEAHARDSLGSTYHGLGRYADAEACYRDALAIHEEFGNRYYQADTLTHIGDTLWAAGVPDAARESWQAALDILEELDHTDAEGVRSRLRDGVPLNAP